MKSLCLGTSLLAASFALADSSADLYAPKDAKMPAGPRKGELIDIHERRPVVILPPSEAARYGARPGDLVIANFSHHDRHWIARIPAKMGDVIPQQDKFPPGQGSPIPAAHTMFRVPTRPGDPILLYPQTTPASGGTTLPAPLAIDGMNLSAEAVGVKGWQYGVVPGMKDEFVIVLRAVGSDTMAQTKIIDRDRVVDEFLAKLPEDVRERYPHAYLELSQAWGYRHMYHSIFQNCDTVQFCILDDLMTYSPARQAFVNVMKFVDAYPIWMNHSLAIRGIPAKKGETWNAKIRRQQNVCIGPLNRFFVPPPVN